MGEIKVDLVTWVGTENERGINLSIGIADQTGESFYTRIKKSPR